MKKLMPEILVLIFMETIGAIFRPKTTMERFFDFLEDNIILLIIGIILIIAIIGLVIYLV